MRCWKVVKLSRASVPHGAKLIPCCWVSQLKFRDGVYECHHARLLLLGYQQEKRMRLSWKLSSRLLSFYYSACPSFHISCRRTFFGSWRRVCFHFKQTCGKQACLHERSTRRVMILVTETTCLCSSAFMASCKFLANITCSVMKFIRRLVWSSLAASDWSWWVYPRLYALRLQHHQATIAHKSRSACHSKFLNMKIALMQLHVYKSCCHPVAATILVMYADNNSQHKLVANYEPESANDTHLRQYGYGCIIHINTPMGYKFAHQQLWACWWEASWQRD